MLQAQLDASGGQDTVPALKDLTGKQGVEGVGRENEHQEEKQEKQCLGLQEGS